MRVAHITLDEYLDVRNLLVALEEFSKSHFKSDAEWCETDLYPYYSVLWQTLEGWKEELGAYI